MLPPARGILALVRIDGLDAVAHQGDTVLLHQRVVADGDVVHRLQPASTRLEIGQVMKVGWVDEGDVDAALDHMLRSIAAVVTAVKPPPTTTTLFVKPPTLAQPENRRNWRAHRRGRRLERIDDVYVRSPCYFFERGE